MGRPRGQGGVAEVPDARQGSPASILGAVGSKYGNHITYVDGQRFASKREAARFSALSIAQRAGAIADLETQVIYRFVVNGVKVGRYTADFRYVDGETGETVVEDSKGKRVRDWYRTKRLMLACFGIEIREV